MSCCWIEDQIHWLFIIFCPKKWMRKLRNSSLFHLSIYLINCLLSQLVHVMVDVSWKISMFHNYVKVLLKFPFCNMPLLCLFLLYFLRLIFLLSQMLGPLIFLACNLFMGPHEIDLWYWELWNVDQEQYIRQPLEIFMHKLYSKMQFTPNIA